MKKIAVLGSGIVGETLSGGFLKHGHEVMRASREPSKLADWKAKAGDRARTGTFAEAAKWGDLVVLAVKGTAAESAVALAGVDNLAGKTVLDATNPIADAPPDSLEATATSDSAWAVLNAEKLRAIGRIPSRLSGKFVTDIWSSYFDVVVVIRREVAPTFDPWK